MMASVFFIFAAYKYAPAVFSEHGALANVMESLFTFR
ncbi:MAG: hypothetical protein G01um10143_361 [Parcubacteria group bacterium Gr01-1014_3]|nr:MAG: hypothetical protein G01um10143_361 [Parcubacteria group bacterium Gr01-1014_3]